MLAEPLADATRIGLVALAEPSPVLRVCNGDYCTSLQLRPIVSFL